MNEMRKLMETVKKAQLNETTTMPTIKQVTVWQVVDDMGESVFHHNVKEAIIDYAESYAEDKTYSSYGNDKRAWDKYFAQGKKIAQGIISKERRS